MAAESETMKDTFQKVKEGTVDAQMQSGQIGIPTFSSWIKQFGTQECLIPLASLWSI